LRAVGPLDAGYFMWWEDVDWCYRAVRSGLSLYVLPDVHCRHVGGESFAAWRMEVRVRQFYLAFFRFLVKHAMFDLAERAGPIVLADLAVKQLAFRLLGRVDAARELSRLRLEIRQLVKTMRDGIVPDCGHVRA